MTEDNYWSNRPTRRITRRRLVGGTAAGLGLLAGACGGSSSKSSRSAASTAPGSVGSSGDQPEKGGVIVQWLNTDPPALDLHQVTSYITVWPAAPCYNQLLQFDPQEPDTKLIPDLADSYQIAGDGKSIVFKLHPGDYQVVMVSFQNALHGMWNQIQNYKLPGSLHTNYRYQDAWLSKA